MKDIIYDHYIAIDWAIKNMAIARLTKKSNKIKDLKDVPSNITELKYYLNQLNGSKILTFEEGTTSQWLYTELRDSVNEVLVCDPNRNRLLEEGPKSDKIDAVKLVSLLKSEHLKPVYHSTEALISLRKLESSYADLIKSDTRLKNQRSALLRSCGTAGKLKLGKALLKTELEQFSLKSIEQQIELCETQRAEYLQIFKKLAKEHPVIHHQTTIPGIGLIGAIKIISRIVAPFRFPSKGHYLSYSGLIKLERNSGGRSYGKKLPRYSRILKSVYKTAAKAAIGGNNPINDNYEYLIHHKGYSEKEARHKICRQLAVLSWGVFKSGKPYQPYRRRKNIGKNQKA